MYFLQGLPEICPSISKRYLKQDVITSTRMFDHPKATIASVCQHGFSMSFTLSHMGTDFSITGKGDNVGHLSGDNSGSLLAEMVTEIIVNCRKFKQESNRSLNWL